MLRLWFWIATIACSASGLSRAVAEDWPEFRGPTGQGISSAQNLPVRWSDTENIRWKTPVPGKGWSSPVTAGGRIYLTSAVPLGDDPNGLQSLRALCFDAATGAELWNVEVSQTKEGAEIHAKNSHASPTPIIDGDRIFVHFGTFGTACLTTEGENVWTNRELVYGPRHGSGGSPVLVGDMLVVSCDGWDVQYVAALDRATGQIRWKTPRPAADEEKKFAFATPLVISVDQRQQVVSPGACWLVSYDPENGQEIWRVNYGDGYSVVPRPLFQNGLLYVCTGFGKETSTLAIRPTGEGDITAQQVQWKVSRAMPTTPSLLLVGAQLYAVTDQGVASCLDAQTGEVHWTKRLGGNFSASPLYGDGKAYFLSEEGQTTVIEPGTEYVELAKNRLGEKAYASPAVIESDLLVRTEGHLYRIGEQAP